MSNLEGLMRQLVSLLRYFAAPVVATIIAWMFDDKHDVLGKLLVWDWIGTGATFSLWPLTAFLAALGILVYFAHRTALHRPMTRLLVWLATRKKSKRPSVNDLAFERWRRRGADEHTHERSSQVVLDEANAAGHFLYCSCWASVLLAVSLEFIFPAEFNLEKRVWGFTATVVVLFAFGLISDWQTMKLDLEAYERFHK